MNSGKEKAMNNLHREATEMLCRVSLLHRYRISLALTGLKIYRGQPQILDYLSAHGDCSQKELAEHLEVSPASIATSLKRMSKSGFIEKAPDKNDKRINRLKITPKGMDALTKGKKECSKVDESMFEGFEESEISAFTQMLGRIRNNLSFDGINEKDAIKFINTADNNRNGDDKND